MHARISALGRTLARATRAHTRSAHATHRISPPRTCPVRCFARFAMSAPAPTDAAAASVADDANVAAAISAAPSAALQDATAASSASAASAPAAVAVAAAAEPDALVPPSFPAHLVSTLTGMGFPLTRAQRGLHATGAVSWERAIDWILEHSEDADIDTPLLVRASSLPPAPAAATASSASSASASNLAERGLPFPSHAPHKLVLCVRGDLHMRTGKIAAQCAHAAVGTLLDLQECSDPRRALQNWINQGQAKVALAIKDLNELKQLQAHAREQGIHTHIVADAGRTQVEAGSQTVLAIGPAPVPLIDAITGHLKLL